MKSVLIALALTLVTTPVLAQNPDPYPGRDWGFSFSPREEVENTSEWVLKNPYDQTVRVKVNIDAGYAIGGNRYNAGETSHILLPPRSRTPLIIDTEAAKGFNENINADIYPY